jgi:hypothetical protein
MKSNKNENSEGKIEKVTESLWKVWWFSFYLVIVPSLVAVVGFFIFFFVGKDLYVSIGLSVLTFMFVLLFFYKAFDKYRNKPFFLNRKNNLSARINIPFLITILALIVTPIFVIFTPGDYYFELLPLISFIVLYNIVYYYFYFQPIDIFDFVEEKYKHEVPFSQWIKQPYNLIMIFNYIIHILFLSYTFDTKVAWLFPLVSNLIFYPISRLTTLKNIKKLSASEVNKFTFLQELTIYKKKLINSILSLNFALLIQMPFVILFVNFLTEIPNEIIEISNISFLALVFLAIYFKFRLYLSSYYSKILGRLETNEFE